MATTLAAVYMNIPVAHTMGGEVSGTIDESIRHAVTKFAHIHFPASKEAAERIIKMGENPDSVYLTGCPRIDLVAEALNKCKDNKTKNLFNEGVGDIFDLNEPFLLVSQHPVTTEYGEGENQITETLKAVKEVGLPCFVLWPNADAGSEHIARGIRKWRENNNDKGLRFLKNMPVGQYIHLMAITACLVGNSSSGIREGAFIGTPTVDIGSRQFMRERGNNVINVDYNSKEIASAIKHQLNNGHYNSEPIYGDGKAGTMIADILATCEYKIQKRIAY